MLIKLNTTIQCQTSLTNITSIIKFEPLKNKAFSFTPISYYFVITYSLLYEVSNYIEQPNSNSQIEINEHYEVHKIVKLIREFETNP